MYGVSANRDAEDPGVWVGFEKICAAGVRIKDRVSMHGIALNINNDLDIFGYIGPCGIKNSRSDVYGEDSASFNRNRDSKEAVCGIFFYASKTLVE